MAIVFAGSSALKANSRLPPTRRPVQLTSSQAPTNQPSVSSCRTKAGGPGKLLLSVIDGPSDSITIKSRSVSGNVTAQGKDVSRNQLIKRVLLSLQSDGDSGLDFRVTNEIVPLWSEALFVLTKVIDGTLKGEKYQLTNTSANLMMLDERELYRRHVVAISIAKPQLSPGESTDVFVMSESTDE